MKHLNQIPKELIPLALKFKGAKDTTEASARLSNKDIPLLIKFSKSKWALEKYPDIENKQPILASFVKDIIKNALTL